VVSTAKTEIPLYGRLDDEAMYKKKKKKKPLGGRTSQKKVHAVKTRTKSKGRNRIVSHILLKGLSYLVRGKEADGDARKGVVGKDPGYAVRASSIGTGGASHLQWE